MEDGAIGGVFDGDDAVATMATGDLIEDVGDVWLWQVGDGMAKFFDRGLVCPSALGAEVGDFEIVLEGEGGGHDFPVDCLDGFLGKAALVHLDEAVEKGLLPLRGVDLEAVAFFDDADFVDEIGALGEEGEEFAVDQIDLDTDVVEVHGLESGGVWMFCSASACFSCWGAERASCFSGSAGVVFSSAGSGRGTRDSSEELGSSSMELMPKCSKNRSVVR